jgi:hypothetical protein
MKELMEYREKLIARLSEATKEFCEACKVLGEFATIADGQTVHRIAFLVRDINQHLFGVRIRKTLEEENPLFKDFDPDQWMRTHYREEEPLSEILEALSANVQNTCKFLNGMPQAGWSRLSRHELLGNELTLQLWVERDLAFIEEQLKTLKNAQKV